MSYVFTAAELRLLREGRVTIPFLRVELASQGTGELRFSGPGEIRYGEQRALQFVLFDERATPEFLSAAVRLATGSKLTISTLCAPIAM